MPAVCHWPLQGTSPRLGLLRRSLLLRCPPQAHSFAGGLSLSGGEGASSLLGWCKSGVQRRKGGRCRYCQRILGWAATALGRSLESFNGSVEFVPLRNQEGENVFGWHPKKRVTRTPFSSTSWVAI